MFSTETLDHPEFDAIPSESGRMALSFPIGLKDRPLQQWQGALVVDLAGAGGHVVLLGSPQSGKTTALKSLMVGAALTHTPAEVGFYAVDMAGSSLRPLAGLPHVGDVATRFDVDKIRRTIAEVAHQLATREHVFRPSDRDGRTDACTAPVRFATRTGLRRRFSGDRRLVDIPGGARRPRRNRPGPVARGLGYGIHVVLTHRAGLISGCRCRACWARE